MHIAILFFIIIALNIPCGYYRAKFEKFSKYWFLFIHLPVPFILLSRILLEIHHSWILTPLFMVAYFTSQFIGQKLRVNISK